MESTLTPEQKTLIYLHARAAVKLLPFKEILQEVVSMDTEVRRSTFEMAMKLSYEEALNYCPDLIRFDKNTYDFLREKFLPFLNSPVLEPYLYLMDLFESGAMGDDFMERTKFLEVTDNG